jgi:hypothetical protein
MAGLLWQSAATARNGGWQSARRGGEKLCRSAVLGSGMRKHATQLRKCGPYVKLRWLTSGMKSAASTAQSENLAAENGEISGGRISEQSRKAGAGNQLRRISVAAQHGMAARRPHRRQCSIRRGSAVAACYEIKWHQ